MYTKYVKDDIMKELCFTAIATEEKIEVAPEEVEAEYKVIAQVTAEDSEEEAAKKVAAAKKQYQIYTVFNHLLNKKVFDFIKANARL